MKYVCPICGYVYDEAKDVPWDSLSESWNCPLCGAAKTDFRPESGEVPKAAAPVLAPVEIRPLNALEVSALCSNLARGCEKQYQPEQADAFRHLAGWFRDRAEKAADPSFAALLEMIERDLEEGYPSANAVASEEKDRGALRSLVWSEKVTRILRSLLARLEQEGEALTENTGVYVCTICGFVYVGGELPEVCPVCKVPNRKFERIGGERHG